MQNLAENSIFRVKNKKNTLDLTLLRPCLVHHVYLALVCFPTSFYFLYLFAVELSVYSWFTYIRSFVGGRFYIHKNPLVFVKCNRNVGFIKNKYVYECLFVHAIDIFVSYIIVYCMKIIFSPLIWGPSKKHFKVDNVVQGLDLDYGMCCDMPVTASMMDLDYILLG